MFKPLVGAVGGRSAFFRKMGLTARRGFSPRDKPLNPEGKKRAYMFL